MNALIIDNDKKSTALVAHGLTSVGCRCCIAPSGEKGLRLATSAAHDVIILDIELPGISGLEVIRRLRESGNKAPIIVLSALSQPGDRISGLNLGADDYLGKPFSIGELLARINAVLRRCMSQIRETITVRDLTVDIPTRTVTYKNRMIDLTAREFEVLEYLARNVGRILSTEMIYQNVWKENSPPPTKVVETRVCMLRKRLGLSESDGLIYTVKGVGYVLK